MLSIGPEFNSLEQAVFHAIWREHLADREALKVQLATATLLSRKNTGVGFYTDFRVERCCPITGDRMRYGPAAKIEGLHLGMGFILWLSEGYADSLEGYSYDESTVEIALDRVGLRIET